MAKPSDLIVIATVATVVLVLALSIGGLRLGGLSLSPLDVAALGAALAVVVALARGSADASELVASRGTGLVLLLIPALVAFVAGIGQSTALVLLLVWPWAAVALQFLAVAVFAVAIPADPASM